MVTQVANHFDNVAAANPKGGVTVQLTPQAMGTITVTIKTTGKQIDTQVAASNPDVKSALEQSRPELSQAMASRGYSVSSMTFSSDSGSSGFQPGGQGKPQPQAAQGPQPVRPTAITTVNLPTISRPYNTAPAAAGVNLWI